AGHRPIRSATHPLLHPLTSQQRPLHQQTDDNWRTHGGASYAQRISLMIEPNIANLGAILRARRLEKRLSLRDLSALIRVSLNTLSRVERGHIPDLKNFQRIVDWLDLPAETFSMEPTGGTTPEVIARHLRSDRLLTAEAATRIAGLVEEMYHKLIGEQPPLALHLRAAKTFTPAAGALLADVLNEMRSNLIDKGQPE
ncbi:MAG: helix-turn-helix domain-containing protein, partial [Actinomycetota bacterium]